MKRLAFIVLIALASAMLFMPSHARADLPFLRTNGSLVNPGDKVIITGLTGQSTCAFYEIGTPGATDVYGSTDSSTLTTNLTRVAVTDYANPPNVQSQPFTPTAGTAYIIAPSSMAQIQITADGTWSGTASVFITCSSSVARAGSGGGGGSITGTEPIVVASGNVSFDYTFGGQFRASQAMTSSGVVPCATALPYPGWIFDALGDGVYEYWSEPVGPFHMGGFAPGCGLNDALTISNQSALGLPLVESSTGDGLLCLVGGIVNSNTSCPSGGGTTYTPGPNVTFSPAPGGSPVAIGLANVPIVMGIEFTPSPNYSPGTLAGFASAGDGNSKLVSVAVSPCPTAGGCVVSVSGSGIVNCTGVAIVNCGGTPNPTCTGAVSCTGSLAANNLVIDVPTPGPAGATPYPTPIVTTSPTAAPNPISVTSSVVAGATIYDLAFGIVQPFNGGLGVDAAGFPNGDCPIFSTGSGTFVAGSCGGGTYFAGLNLTLTSNTFALSNTVNLTTGGYVRVNALNTTGFMVWDTPLSTTGCANPTNNGTYVQTCLDGSGNPYLFVGRGTTGCYLTMISGPAGQMGCTSGDVFTILSPTLSGPTLTGTVAGSPTFSGSPTFNGIVNFGVSGAVNPNVNTPSMLMGSNAATFHVQMGVFTGSAPTSTTCLPTSSTEYAMFCIANNDLPVASFGISGFQCDFILTTSTNFANSCPEVFSVAPTITPATASTSTCFNASKQLVSCGSGQVVTQRGYGTCTIAPAGTGCSQSITIPSTTDGCTVTAHGSQPSDTTIPYSMNANPSGTTLVVQVTYTAALSSGGSPTYFYACYN